ncbi:MAG: 50S ribosomal protein L20 [Alphaproteobacteria bacterium GM7ARS4]|nr:50S ribosomal protein L20 [Alphaproteobacteria bacterium GM7ARS4]
MTRASRAVPAHRRHRKIIKQARGYRGRGKNTFRMARQMVERALCYSYQHRRKRKGDFKRLWIQRINAAARVRGMTYSVFMGKMRASGIDMDRKMLALLAMEQPGAFDALVEKIKASS